MTLGLKTAWTATFAAALVACGGGGEDAPISPAPSTATVAVRGAMVKPVSVTASAVTALNKADASFKETRLQSLACPDVPDGYDPIISTPVEFRDAAGAVLSTLTTDSCGAFTGNVATGATVAVATPTGVAPIRQPIASLIVTAGSTTPTLVSALPTGASYVISVVQDTGNGRLAMTVSDSLSGKAVLGLTAADFAFSLGANPLALTSLSYGASLAQSNASVSVVLDSSSSMSTGVGTTGRSRYQVAAIAGHELLNGLTTGSDEINMTLFASRIFPMNDFTLASLSWTDLAGVITPAYTFSTTGTTRTVAALRPLVDAYNPQSAIYRRNTTGDAVHPDTGTRRIGSSYAFGGNTAFYDGTLQGITNLSTAVNPRKIVVAMTDGQENASRSTLEQVIQAAITQGVPLFTVAFGSASSVNEANMQAMADRTGGQYRRVEGIDLAGLFQGIQTGIRFQYLAALGSTPVSGSVVTITLSRGAVPVVRTVTIR